MKKIFTLLFSIAFYFSLSAQAPQGINYQAVAYNNLSQPVTNQSVGVRLSILDGGAAGPVLYSETQAPNTDNTGLFSIVIGNGTPVSGTFAGINWANGNRWLKTEIDIAGGNNYVVMGSSQFMSVPYALYAEKTGYSSGSFNIPDGFENTTTVVIPMGVNYTVPAGKNLYLPSACRSIVIDTDTLASIPFQTAEEATGFAGASENSIVTNPIQIMTGFLVDKKVEWETTDIALSNFTVPADKYFVIVSSHFFYRNPFNNPQAGNCQPTINGLPGAWSMTHTILSPGTVLSTIGCTAATGPAVFVINGYFKKM